MKLSHKNFLYTGVVTSILTVLVLGYFILMLPSLYVDYISKENYNSILEQHKGYLEDGSYENVNIKNPSCITIDIPFLEDSFVVTGKAFQARIAPSSDKIRFLFLDVKSFIKYGMESFQDAESGINEDKFTKELEEKVLEWKHIFLKEGNFSDELPFEVKIKSDSSTFKYYQDESFEINYISDDTFIIEAGVKDGDYQYTNYIGLTFDNDRVVVSYLPAMTPQMNEITPIVLHSLPMLIAVIILFALVVSYLYSKGIVGPIIKLVKHTETVKRNGIIAYESLPVKGNDEIAMLIQTLNDLYEELDKNYKSLENKNNELKDKNKRQEVFLRSSSHQLKTPIAAALLLVEGMINQIGKYQDTKAYLPEVKKQLLSMRKIVEDILYLSRLEENITFERVDINLLVDNQISNHQIQIAEGNYKIVTDYSDNCFVITDSNLLSKILENLILNGIDHSKEGATIRISTKANQFEIYNSNAHIEEDMMPHIFEPFVSGNHSGKGHGLGLYIVAYYAKILNAAVNISNSDDGVLTKIIFNHIPDK